MDWNKQSHLYVPLVAVEDLLSKKKKKMSKHNTYLSRGWCLQFFPHSAQPEIKSQASYHDSLFFGGIGKEGKKMPACLFWMLYWQGGFPCSAWMTELPHKSWQLLTPTWDVFVCVRSSFIGVYTWQDQAACLHAGPLTCLPRMWVFAYVFLHIMFVAK